MPTLIHKGDTISNFGKFLPAPYINRVAIADSTSAPLGEIRVELSIMLVVEDGVDEDQLIDSLGQLNVYLYFAKDSEEIQSIIDKTTNVFCVFGDYLFSYVQTEIENFTKSDEVLYDENDNRVVRLTTTLTGIPSQYSWNDITDLTTFAFVSIVDYDEITIEDELENLTL